MATDLYPLGMGIQPPALDIKGIGELPAIMEEAKLRQLRSSLGNLDVHTIKGLEDASARLLAGGDIEGGMKYLGMAQARRETERKAAADQITIKWLENYGRTGGMTGGRPPGTTSAEEPAIDIPIVRQPLSGGGATVPAPAFPPSPLGPRSEADDTSIAPVALNSLPPVPTSPIPRPRGGKTNPTLVPGSPTDTSMPPPMIPLAPGEPLNPGPGPLMQRPMPGSSEELLARAEGGGTPGLPPGPQTAQLGGGSVPLPEVTVTPGERPVPPPGPAVPGLPSWLEGAQARPAVTQPAGAAAPKYSPIGLPPDVEAARREAADVGSRLASRPPAPKGQKDPVGEALMAQFKDAMSRLKMSQSDKDYYIANIQRLQEGKSALSKDDWELDKKISPERYKEAEKVYLGYEDKAKGSADLLNTLDRMDQIRKDPNFITGEGASDHRKVVSFISSLAQMAQLSGIKAPNLGGLRDKINSIADPHLKAAALNEEFTSLANAALMAHVGNLSKAFSDADRQFVEKIFPSILQTPGGIERVMGNLRAMAEYSAEIGKKARGYMSDKEMRATPYGVHDAVQKYRDEHPLFTDSAGNPTPLAQSIMTSGAQPPLIGAMSPAPPAPPAPARAALPLQSPPGIVMPGQGLAPNLPGGSGVPLPRPRPYEIPPQTFPATRNPRMRPRLEDLEP